MADFMKCGDNFKISIPDWKNVDNCTFYNINVQIKDVCWTVSHRYSEFVKLHEVLVADHGVTSDILPPKKVLGNRDESFIEKRRQGLESYLSTVIMFLQKTMPKVFAVFLNFDKFDILFIVKNLAVNFFLQGEAILSKTRHYAFTPLQIYAISERLKQPCSNLDLIDQREDFSHVLDFCCQLTEVVIAGSDVIIPNSNIVPNNLPLQFTVFKALEHLTLKKVNCSKICELGTLRFTLKKLTVTVCNLESLSNLFLSDQIHKTNTDPQNEWKALTDFTLSQTPLTKFDQSICLVPNLKNLIADDNNIDCLSNLEHLPRLLHLSLRNNNLNLSETFEMKIKNIVSLNLSQNSLTTLKPFSHLVSLETLDLQSNQINNVEEVRHIAQLPCLENLVLSGNPVSIIVDYRVKVLAIFGGRAFRICLDNECTNQKELDKVAILKALRASKEGLPYVNVSP